MAVARAHDRGDDVLRESALGFLCRRGFSSLRPPGTNNPPPLAPPPRGPRRDRVCGHELFTSRHDAGAAGGAAGVNRRVLGRTGLAVSEIGFGAWAIGGNAYGNSYGPTDDAESKRAIRRAYELGCNFFDTADVYGHGHSETLLGEALHDVRDEVIIATKVGGNFYNRDIHPLMRDRIAQTIGRPLNQIADGGTLPVTHDANFTPSYLRFAVERSLERDRKSVV